jgi:anti-sigma B factor antagonist
VDPGRLPAFKLTLSARTADGVAIAELGGALEMTSSPALRDQLRSVLLSGSGRLVIDLSGVTSCDASGLAVLVGTRSSALLLGGWVRLAAIPPQVDDVLRRTGLHPHLDVFLTVEGAAVGAAADQRGRVDAPGGDLPGRSVAQPASARTGIYAVGWRQLSGKGVVYDE